MVQDSKATASAQGREKTNRRVRFREVQSQAKLHVDFSAEERKKFQFRWVNDTNGRVDELKKRGYEVVDDPVKAAKGGNERRVGTQQTGQRLNARLMRLPKEFHDEDMADRRALIKEQRAAMAEIRDPKRDGAGEDDKYSRITENKLTIS